MSTGVESAIGVVEMIHGVPVADPYRWLEDRSSPATEAWLAEQRERFESYFAKLGDLSALRVRVKTLLDVEATDQIGKVRDRYFYRKRRAGEQQPSIYFTSPESGEGQVLVNAQNYGSFTSVAIHRISENASFLAFELKHGGEHTKELHIVDTRTGQMLPDYLENGRACGFAFANDDRGFYYCHEFVDRAFAQDHNHQVLLHQFGTPREADRVLLQLPKTEQSKVVLIYDGDSLGAIYNRKQDGHTVTDLYVSDQNDANSWTCVCAARSSHLSPFFYNGRLFAHNFAERPNGEIVELDLRTGNVRNLVVPERTTRVQTCILAGGRLFVSYIVGTESVIHIHSLDGGGYETLELDTGFLWGLVPSFTNHADELFLSRESINSPPALFRCDPTTFKLNQWSQVIRSDGLTLASKTTVHFLSQDGTQIEISLFGLNAGAERTEKPMIMTGYGGFGVTLLSRFSPFVTALLEQGFLFAIPRIRGGGEHGENWHLSATGRQRQVAYDDFLGAAQWLCDEGFTRPEHFAIFGGSNAALLVGVAITQRPDLFGAAICIAPILDMVRYHLFDRAHVWSDEYGTADDPEDFRALYASSPYHHVLEQVDYPAVLFVTGDQDTRCNPAHARKMAAALLNRGAQVRPILVDHTSERGHAPVLPLEVRVEAMIRRIAFLCHELGAPTRGGGAI